MASSGAQVAPPTIAQLTAPIARLVGTLLDYFLFGILTSQLYVYLYSFPKDKVGLKILIWSVYLIELAQVCCAAADFYYWFGAGFGNLARLNEVYISPLDTPVMGSITALIVQLFFCFRIWKLRKNDWYIIICVVIALISVVQFVGGTVGGLSSFLHKYFSASRANEKIYAYLWLVGEAVSDVLIAITMTFLLLGAQNEFTAKSRSIVIRIDKPGLGLVASVAVVSVIFFVAVQGTNYFITTTIVLGKLYSNTLLATLNHRIFLRQNNNDYRPGHSTKSSNSSGALLTARQIV